MNLRPFSAVVHFPTCSRTVSASTTVLCNHTRERTSSYSAARSSTMLCRFLSLVCDSVYCNDPWKLCSQKVVCTHVIIRCTTGHGASRNSRTMMATPLHRATSRSTKLKLPVFVM